MWGEGLVMSICVLLPYIGAMSVLGVLVTDKDDRDKALPLVILKGRMGHDLEAQQATRLQVVLMHSVCVCVC
jgi:hypothetical protein